MKKFLLTAALVLALATSLTAGTMAYYNQAPATFTDENLTATTFHVDGYRGTAATNRFENLPIYPGCDYTYQYTLENTEGTDADVTTLTWLTCDVNNGKLPDGMTITTKVNNTGNGTSATNPNAETAGITDKFSLNAKGAAADTKAVVTVNVKWVYGATGSEADDNKYYTQAAGSDAGTGAKFTLNFKYSAQQAASTATSNNGNQTTQDATQTIGTEGTADYGI